MGLIGVSSGSGEAAVGVGADPRGAPKVGTAAAEVLWQMSEGRGSMRGHFLLASGIELDGRDLGDDGA